MKKQILIDFGNRVRKERTKLGWSQEELAERAGVHRTYIGMVERAEKNATIASIKKISEALKVRISSLIEGR